MRLFAACFLFVLALASCAQETSCPSGLDYDRKASLDIKETNVYHRGPAAVHDISYASPKGGRVPAYLVVPDGKGPSAAVDLGALVLVKFGVS